MKYHSGNILCLEYAELVPSILSEPNYKWHKKQGNITVIGRGGNGNTILIEYETMPAKCREAIKKQYGDPYIFMSQQPILELISWDLQAERFYKDYVLPNRMKLPDDYVQKYTNAASWLNTISYLTTDKRALKSSLNITIADFWNTITDLIRAKNVHLPTSEKRLKERLKDYKGQNYASFIEAWRFGNSNSKKVDDDIAEALLLEMIGHDHQHDYTVIAAKYKEWATAAGKLPITPGAVGYWAKKNAHLVTQSREGKAVNYNKFNKHILRDRPSAPMLLINSDDNVLDLYFIEEKVNKQGYVTKNHYYRPVLYVVIDAYNDYILGYAIGETVTIGLVKEAYRNAANHVKQLLNGYYLPHQIQTDRWGLGKGNELERFYQSMAVHTPATARVAQGKYIERTFGVTWHQTLKHFINYSGQNITAKERLNPDAVDKNKANFPTVNEAPAQVALFIEHMRQAVNPSTGKPRQQEWIEAVQNSEKSQQRQIDAEKHLRVFGILHEPKNGRQNSLQPAGLTIKDGKFTYEIPAEYFPQQMGKKVQVYYDPYDMRQVLVTDGNGLRFVAENYIKSPSAIADHTEESRQLYWKRMDEKKAIAAVPGQAQAKRRETLDRAQIDAASLLQSGTLIKQVRQHAERSVHGLLEELSPSTMPNEQESKKSIYDRM